MKLLNLLAELFLSVHFWLVIGCVIVQMGGWSDLLALHREDFSDTYLPVLHLLSYAFAHGNWIHLLVNAWVLLNFSPPVERLIGRILFLALFFTASMVGGLLEFLMNPQTDMLVGASAGICGVVTFFLLLEPTARVFLLVFELPARWALIVLCWGSLFLAEVPQMNFTIAHWAHIGGLIVGIIIYGTLKWQNAIANFSN